MNTLKTLITTAALLVVTPFAITAQAQAVDHGNMPGMKVEQPAATEMSDGEVRKIDKAAGTVTLKHGDIPSLDMMGMTMVFKVKDRAMLDGVAVGSKVRFRAERQGGSMVVTQWVLQK